MYCIQFESRQNASYLTGVYAMLCFAFILRSYARKIVGGDVRHGIGKKTVSHAKDDHGLSIPMLFLSHENAFSFLFSNTFASANKRSSLIWIAIAVNNGRLTALLPLPTSGDEQLV